jgi:hypothetical protein
VARWACSIDFGTSFTTAAVPAASGRARLVPIEAAAGPRSQLDQLPSLVFRDNEKYLVGREAGRRGADRPGRLIVAPKLALGAGLQPHPEGVCDVSDEGVDEQLPAPDVCAAILREAWQACLRTRSAAEAAEAGTVVLTHPAAWRERIRVDALRSAAAIAGIPAPALLAEPVAACAALTAAGGQLPDRARVLVYDLGGGSCDLAVLEKAGTTLVVLATGGCEDVGGEDFDARLFARVCELIAKEYPEAGESLREAEQAWQEGPDWPVARQRLLEDVTVAREELSAQHETVLLARWPTGSKEIRLTRSELEDLLAEPLARTSREVELTLAQAGTSTLHTTYLVGGASRTPAVTRMLSGGLDLNAKLVAAGEQAKAVVALGGLLTVTAQVELHHKTRQIDHLRRKAPSPPPPPPRRWRPASSIRVKSPVCEMALVGNDKVAVVGSEDEISCWGLDGDRRWTGNLGIAPSSWVAGTCVAASPDGTKIVAGSDIGGRVEAWSASGEYQGNMAPVQRGGYLSDKYPAAVAIADNGDVAVARVCGIVDLCRNGQIAHRREEGRPRGIVIGPSGHIVSCGSFGINIQASDGELQRYTSAFDAVNVAVSPDSKHVAAATGNQVRIFLFGEPAAGPVHTLTVDSGSVTRVAYCPVGGYLAAGTSSGAVRVWAADRSKAGTFTSTDNICGLAFARSGDRLVAVSTDGRVRWWDLS